MLTTGNSSLYLSVMWDGTRKEAALFCVGHTYPMVYLIKCCVVFIGNTDAVYVEVLRIDTSQLRLCCRPSKGVRGEQ